MHAELISVGTELLLGDILNTNAQYLSRCLAQQGIDVYYQSTVGDNVERLKETLAIAVSRSNIIILTGGLGPTQDDITVETVADLVGLPLIEDKASLDSMRKHFKQIGREMTDNNRKQALVPEGATVFRNNHGTAPGCAIAQGEQVIIMLPGVPWEMQAMYEESVGDYLAAYSGGVLSSQFVNIFGIGESAVSELLDDMINASNPTVAPYAKDGEVSMRVTAKAETKQDADDMCAQTVQKIVERLGSYVYSVENEKLENAVCRLLSEDKKTLATAESCTAGLISKRITDVSGASKVFLMGAVTYSNDSKTELLGVEKEAIDRYYAVSPQVAAQMAQGALYKSDADYALSITGLAGPDSDESGQEAGIAFIGLADKENTLVFKVQYATRAGREYVRTCFASAALNILRLKLEGYKLEDIEYLQLVSQEQTPEKPEPLPAPEPAAEPILVRVAPHVPQPSPIIPPMNAVLLPNEPVSQEELNGFFPEVNMNSLPEVDKDALADSLDSIF